MQSTLTPIAKSRTGLGHGESGKLPAISTGHSSVYNLSPGSAATDRKNAILSAEQRAAAQKDVNGRPASISSSSQATSGPLTTVTSSEIPDQEDLARNPFTRRHGRRYLRDSTLAYPLPSDLREIHRQVLRTVLLCQVFGAPVCSPNVLAKPPQKVLEMACGSGYWSSVTHDFFSKRGHPSIQFTGLDVAPVAPENLKEGMKWRFVQHDMRRQPLPFEDSEFDLVMIRDMSLIVGATTALQQQLMDEYLRILRPGGTLEVWDGDHTIRTLLHHSAPKAGEEGSSHDDQVHANATGTYTLTAQTPFSAPQNQYLLDFNSWIVKALDRRQLTAMPCTIIRPWLLQEAETLIDIDCRRLAVPLGEVRWEREGVGGAATAKTVQSSKGKAKESERKVLSAGQAALRRTALLIVVQYVESLEPLLRKVSGKGQDEWDRWMSGLLKDLMENNGTAWGECMEVGAWWARKRGSS